MWYCPNPNPPIYYYYCCYYYYHYYDYGGIYNDLSNSYNLVYEQHASAFAAAR
jgi:hypothetical protein